MKKVIWRLSLASIICIALFAGMRIIPFFWSKDISCNTSLLQEIKADQVQSVHISFRYNDTQLSLHSQPYAINKQIFLPLEEVLDFAGFPSQEYTIAEDMMYANIGRNTFKTRKINGMVYISIQDVLDMYGLETVWNYSESCIYFKDRPELKKAQQPADGPTALIRLEDISPGGAYESSSNLRKLRFVADLLYTRGVPFHVAWIPRYIDPSHHYECDPASEDSIYAYEFIYTLQYLIRRGGVIGLHGYTHQYGDTTTALGFEFYNIKDKEIPATPQYAKERIENAIDAALTLHITPWFFESPHYASTFPQKKVFERYFSYIYEPNLIHYYAKKNKQIFQEKNGVYYIPTPLGYQSSTNSIADRLNSIKRDTLASFFYHPMLEFKYLHVQPDGSMQYDKSSPLHKILDTFGEKGYTFKTIMDACQ